MSRFSSRSDALKAHSARSKLDKPIIVANQFCFRHSLLLAGRFLVGWRRCEFGVFDGDVLLDLVDLNGEAVPILQI